MGVESSMRKLFAFLVWLFSFWTWQDFILRWLWNPATSLASDKPLEHLPSQGGQEESEFARFLSSLPEDGRGCSSLFFDGDSPVKIDFGRFGFTFHHGTILKADYCEFLEAVASSKIVFDEEVKIGTFERDVSCRHLEAFANALHLSDNRFKKLTFECNYGSLGKLGRCLAHVLSRNIAIEDLYLELRGLKDKMDKEVVAEFVAIIGMPHNLEVLKSFVFNALKLDGEGMEQLMKLFQGSNVLEKLAFRSLTSNVQFEHISGMLAISTSLKSLQLHRDSIASQKPFVRGYTSLAIALESNQSLEALSCHISSSMELRVLLDPLMPKSYKLQCNTTLTKLRLWYSIGGQEGIETLVDLIRTNTSLLELGLKRVDDLSLQDTNGIENVLAILEALKTNKSLKIMSFSECEAVGGYKVLGAMMDLLLENHSSEYIDLSGMELEETRDADYVYFALSKRRKMKLWSIVQNMAIVNPTSGRVFLCGEPFVGKTRL